MTAAVLRANLPARALHIYFGWSVHRGAQGKTEMGVEPGPRLTPESGDSYATAEPQSFLEELLLSRALGAY